MCQPSQKGARAIGGQLFLIVTFLAAGCGGPNAVPIPNYDPEGIAQRAMAEYDKNHDGKLDAAELEQCPALKEALPDITKNKSYLTEDDLVQRLGKFKQSNVGLMGVRAQVLRDDKGVAGVTVTFIPEKFMGEAIKAGSGISNDNGLVTFRIPGEETSGLSLGYYRIEVSLKDEMGKETLPAWLNTDTKLGHEVSHLQSPTVIINLP